MQQTKLKFHLSHFELEKLLVRTSLFCLAMGQISATGVLKAFT
jgi:hypothetical protein